MNSMRHVYFVFLICLIKNTFSSCVTSELCINNATAASETFVNTLNHELQRSAAAMSKHMKHIQGYIASLNSNVTSGPGNCLSYQLKANAIDHLAKIYLSCGPAILDNPFLNDEKLINEYLPKLADKEINREEVCKDLVPAINRYCKMVKQNGDVLANCDVKEKFYYIYVQKWEECVMNV